MISEKREMMKGLLKRQHSKTVN